MTLPAMLWWQRWRRVGFVLAMAAGLAGGCSSLLPHAPERTLYRLMPAISLPTGLPHVSAQLVVATPVSQGGLDTRRIVLSRPQGSLDFYADGEWAERLPLLVQTALIDGFDKSGAIAAVSSEGLGLNADFVLESELANFEASLDSPKAAPRIVIRLDLKLVRMPERKIVAQSSVNGGAVAASNELSDIVRAFNVALGSAVADTVGWTLSNVSLPGRPGSVISRSRFVRPAGDSQK